jgi:hypothetical protein
MSVLFGGARNTQATKLGGIRVQTAEYGVAIPVVLGNNRLGVKLIDYTDFNPVAQNQGGGKGGGQASSYEYYAAVLMLLCEGPCGGFGSIYDSSGTSYLLQGTATFVIGGNFTVPTGQASFYYDGGVTIAEPFSVTATDYGGNGTTTTNGTQQVAMERVDFTTAVNAGEYTVETTNNNGLQGVYRFNGADYGKTATLTYTYTSDAAGNTSPIEVLKLQGITGTRPQSPWGYMQSAHPERALSYAGRVMIADSNMDLGSDATIPNFQFEILEGGGINAPGTSDCNFADVVTAILGNPYWGALWPYLGDLTAYRNYSQANGLFISPVYDSAAALSEVLKNLLDISNSEAVFANKVLTIVPYGDTTVTGNGATFTPDTQPVLDLDDTDILLTGPDDDGIAIGRPDLTDNYNHYFIEFGDRAANYNTNTIEDKDEAAIDQYGYRTGGTITAHAVTQLAVAQKVINTIVRRSAYPLATYTFKLPFWYSWILPMQLVTLTKPKLGMNRLPVRIKQVQEESDDSIEVTAETFPWGVALPAIYSTQPTGGVGPSGRAFPGPTSGPILFDASPRLTGTGLNETWMGLSGSGTNWGGCNVWLSLDGVNFAKIGTQFGKARRGVLTAAFAAGADPDTANSIAVDVSQSSAVLNSGTQSDADNLTTLCYVDGELVSYQTATLTGANTYTLGTYLRRGIFSTPISAHATGSPFLRLDALVYRWAYDPSLSGKTVYFKYTSVNLFAQQEQSLASVIAFPYTVGANATFSQNMVVDAVVDAAGTGATIRAYSSSGGPGTGGSATLANGTSISLPPLTEDPFAFSTVTYVLFELSSGAYTTTTDPNSYQNLVASQSYVGLGSVTTPPAPGSTVPLVLRPTSFVDSGSTTTTNPASLYGTSGNADVNGYVQQDGGTDPGDPGGPEPPGEYPE